MPLLEVENLKTYFYGDDTIVKAVDGISYNIEEGETVALVGESGCGKSVSSLSILGLIPSPPGRIVDGEVRFRGTDLIQLPPSDMRKYRSRRIAMVFQEPMSSLNPVINIETQLTEGMMTQLGLTNRQAKDRALELLETVGISDPERRLAQFPHEFSGGMRQRVMIAIALSCEPDLIIADEPTTSLDVTIQAQILDLMQTLTRERDMALLLITHNLGVVARYVERINIMYAGRIIEHGSSTDIFEKTISPLHRRTPQLHPPHRPRHPLEPRSHPRPTPRPRTPTRRLPLRRTMPQRHRPLHTRIPANHPSRTKPHRHMLGSQRNPQQLPPTSFPPFMAGTQQTMTRKPHSNRVGGTPGIQQNKQ